MNASNAARLRAPLLLVTDRQIAREAARGEGRAFAALYERYHQELYRYCHSILGNGDDALDALHNTMARVLRALPGEEREIALRPWLYRIAHNESISLLRDRRAHAELDEASQIESPGVEQQTAIRAQFRQLTADLGQLAERQRSALVMRELSGLDYGEIAQALGTTEAAAKQTVYEARVALQALAQGRDMDCEAVQRSVSDGDGRFLRARRVRSHLRSCARCRAFSDAIASRRAQLTALAPSLSVAGAASLLQGLLGGGAQAGAGGGGGILAALLGGGTAKTLVTSSAAKVIVAGAITVGAGVEISRTTDVVGGGEEPPAVEAPAVPGSSAPGSASRQSSSVDPAGADGSLTGAGRRAQGNPTVEPGRLAGSSRPTGNQDGWALGDLQGPSAETTEWGPLEATTTQSPPAHSYAGGRVPASPAHDGHGPKGKDALVGALSAEAHGRSDAAPGHSGASADPRIPPGQLQAEKLWRPAKAEAPE
jgi:RNA polymerase sigma factor (sigma-70 family)